MDNYKPGAQKMTYTVKEAAQLLGLGLNSMYALLRQNRLAHIKVGKKMLIPCRELEAFLVREIES